MPRNKALSSKSKGGEYTLLAIRVDTHNTRSAASISLTARHPQSAFERRDDDPVYECETEISLSGVVTYPDERAGQNFSITLHGDDSPSSETHATLKDIAVLDQYGSPTYREYRGRHIPVYKLPSGLGLIEKVRGEPAWTAWAKLPRRALTDMAAILAPGRQLYLEVQERKSDRVRWVNSIAIQTFDPAAD